MGQPTGEVDLAVENIGGIDRTEVTIEPGVTILSGRNATNRTSFLQSIMAAVGSNAVSIKGDADEAVVSLTMGDVTHERTLKRQNGTITGGDGICEQIEVAEQFSFLLSTNEARRRVKEGGDLRELIMAPIDTDEIEAEIQQLTAKRNSISDEIERIESLKGDLPDLEEERSSLESAIERKREELQELEDEIASQEASIEQTKSEQDEMEAKLDELGDRRGELDDVRFDIETTRETIAELQAERDDLQREIEETSVPDADSIVDLETEVERLRSQKRSINAEISDLQTIIGFNEDVTDDVDTDVLGVLKEEGEITDDLLPDESVTCWTCGTEVSIDRIESTIDRLRETTREKVSKRTDIDDELAELEDKKESLAAERERLEDRKDRLATIEGEIDDAKSSLDSLQDRRDDLIAAIETLEAEVDELETEGHEEILSLHQEANEFEHDIGRMEGKLESVLDEIEQIEDQIDDLDNLQERRASIRQEIADLRTKIEDIESEAVEAFNEHMDEVLDHLEYDNLERIWLERLETEGHGNRTESRYDLHVVRRSDSGRAYEDTIAHLSESEREVTGLIFALAGYLAHDVHEHCPFMLLDSLEAIDADRIAKLVEYFREYTDYLVVALLPEDAAAIDVPHQTISDI